MATCLLYGCKKEKIDFTYDNTPEELAYSGVRFINLGDYRHVVVDGDTITYSGKSWINGNPPTAYFPTPGGLMEHNWLVPEGVFGDKEGVDIYLQTAQGFPLHFKMSKPGNKKIDYYTIHPIGSGQPAAVPIERDETPPSRDGYFKIRILNLTKYIPGLPIPADTGPLENLYGNVTLTYADGTPVSAETSNVTLGQRASEYIELPYGTYQFRILAGNGSQISAGVHGVNKKQDPKRKLDPATSRIIYYEQNNAEISHSTYAPLMSYEPGGVYSIVVSPQLFDYYPSIYIPQTLEAVQNHFQIITDRVVPTNNEFVRVQAIHAAPYADLRVRFQGKQSSAALSMGEVSDYQVYTATDSLRYEILDIRGNTLAEGHIAARGNQNISLWITADAQGKIIGVPVHNDLSKDSFLLSMQDYGEQNRFEKTAYTGLRFLNFCADEPLINFTSGDGQDIPRLSRFVPEEPSDRIFNNVYTNQPKTNRPYLYWDDRFSHLGPLKIHVYRSVANITPGIWLNHVDALQSEHFVANPALYSQLGREVPYFESGVYSIALIGSTKEDTAYPARIIIVKHSR